MASRFPFPFVVRTLLFLSLLLVPLVAQATTDNETVTSLPGQQPNAQSYADTRTFLKQELPAILAKYFPYGFVFSGGLPATAGTCTPLAISLDAFTSANNRVTADGAGGTVAIDFSAANIGCNCANPGSDTAWLVASSAETATLPASNFQRVGTSNFYVDCTSATQPTLPADALFLAYLTITNGAITDVADMRALTPLDTIRGQRVINATLPPYNAPRDNNGDAAAAINTALTDAAASGYAVYLPCGSYRTTAQIAMQSNTELFGTSRDCVTILPDTATSIPRPIVATSVSNVSIHDLKVDCGDETVAGRQGIAGLNGTTYMRVERTHVRRCGQYGLVFGDTSAAPYSSGGAGIEWVDNIIDMGNHPAGACTGNLAVEYFPRGPVGFLANPGPIISRNIIFAEDTDGGIKINNARGARITDNYVSGGNCSTATGGIITVASSGVTIADNEVYDSRIGINFGNVPRSNATGGNELRTEMTTIATNMVQRPGTAGIFSSDGSVDTLVEGNLVRLDGGTGTSGILLQPTDAGSSGASYTRTSIRNNHIVGLNTGIALLDDTSGTLGYVDTTISNNTTSVTDGTGFGVTVENGTGHTLISHNAIIGHIAGIAVGGAARTSYAAIIGNNMRQLNSSDSANRDCIQVVGDYPRIVANYCDNAGGFHAKWGVRLNATQGPHIDASNQWVAMDTGDIVLVNSGSMTLATPALQDLCGSQAAVTAPADTNNNTLTSCVLPAYYFTLFGGVHIVAFGETAGAGGTKDLTLDFGGTVLGATVLQTAAGNQVFRYDAYVWMPDTSVTAQHAFVQGWDGTTLDVSEYESLAVNTTAGTITIALKCAKNTAGDTCRSRGMRVFPWR